MAGRAFVSRFSPNRTDPAVLEAIFVQRYKLAEVWLERLRDSVLTGVKHHLLAVGPRGCGKSHLVALLVSRLRKDPAVRERVCIAWLPEDEATTSFWKFLLRILRALNVEYGDEFPPPPRDQLADEPDYRRIAVLTDYILKKLKGRTLLVVVENLDDVMRGLKDEGQKRWRAFLQEHRVTATLATTQQITEDMSGRNRPFFGFFQVEQLQQLSGSTSDQDQAFLHVFHVEHLQPLSADEALSLLQKIAEHNNNRSLAAFLQTPTGRARVRAIRHITGGSHRVFIILSEFATRENLDDLVTAFEELLDELTPYYQERLRWLPDQQREIVEFLCRQARTVAVKEIAAELYLTEQTAAAQLKQLKEKGYVTTGSVGRESRYELAEPLMRLCVEVKDPRREPIRLIVEFLRIWYDRAGVQTRLLCLPAGADLERRYYQAVLQVHPLEFPGPIEAALDRDLEAARATGDQEQVVRLLVELAATADSSWRCCAIARELSDLGQYVEVLPACERAIELEPKSSAAWLWKGATLHNLGRHTEALVACDRATELDPNFAAAWVWKGLTLRNLRRPAEALAAGDRATELDPNFAAAWVCKGQALHDLSRYAEALAAGDRATELDPNSASAWVWKGLALNTLGRYVEALTALDRAIKIDPKHVIAWGLRCVGKMCLGRKEEVIEDVLGLCLVTGGKPGLALAFEGLAEYLPDVIAIIFEESTNRGVWAHRVGRLADITREVQEDREQKKAQEKTTPTPSPADTAEALMTPNPLAMLGDSLVRSLTKTPYAEASPDALDAWADVWREVALRHPDLSLATRLFSVGVRYLRAKDERVLLDLVQEERSILRDLFGLDDGTDQG